MKLNYFNFRRISDKILLTNDLGCHVFVDDTDFKRVIAKKIDLSSPVGKELLEAGMVYEDSELHFSESAMHKLREAKTHLATATSLHIFVVTTACNMNCVYCQANNGTVTPNCFMDDVTAKKAVDIALQSPETNLSFEFQGGEPLLNFPVVKHIVEYAKQHNDGHNIEYNLVSNLTLLDDNMLDFFEQHKFSISTSVDGNRSAHDRNRIFKDGGGTYEIVAEKIKTIRDRGIHVGAIETTTRTALAHAAQMIDAYIDMGFDSIFIRHLTQLGKASKGWDEIGYSAEEFLDFYREAVDKLIDINKTGKYISEQHASIFLKRMSGKRMNYMELRSPCGGGIGQLAYFADGRVFTCDEGRMLAEMGIDAFQVGNVFDDTYDKLIESSACRTVCLSSALESLPSCCDCAYQPYCGTCPVVSYAVCDDVIEKHPRSFRCKIYAGILDYIFEKLLENDEETIKVLNSWSE